MLILCLVLALIKKFTFSKAAYVVMNIRATTRMSSSVSVGKRCESFPEERGVSITDNKDWQPDFPSVIFGSMCLRQKWRGYVRVRLHRDDHLSCPQRRRARILVRYEQNVHFVKFKTVDEKRRLERVGRHSGSALEEEIFWKQS